jgi:hypothetical protein
LIYNNNKSNSNEERAHIFITLQQQQTDQIGFIELKCEGKQINNHKQTA